MAKINKLWYATHVIHLMYILICEEHCVKSVQVRSFFWSVFCCIRTEYGDLRSKSSYSVRIQEHRDQKKFRIQWESLQKFTILCYRILVKFLYLNCRSAKQTQTSFPSEQRNPVSYSFPSWNEKTFILSFSQPHLLY